MNDPRTQTNSVETFLTSPSALDTSSDVRPESLETSFEGEECLSGPALLELAQRAVAERDALRGEVTRLREALSKSEATLRRGHSSSRELLELREGLELREREVRRLKDSNVARERLLVDARTRLDEAMHLRAAAVAKMELRDRAATEAEAQRDAAMSEAHTWRKKHDVVDAELSRATSAERVLTASFDDARLQLADASRTIAALRSELEETRDALADSDASSVRREEEHRAELERIEARWRTAMERLETRLTAEHQGRELGVRWSLSERLLDETDRFTRDRAALRAEIRAALDDTDRLREEADLDRAAWKARNEAERDAGEAALDGASRGFLFRLAEQRVELEVERASRMCEASRQGQAMKTLREAHERAIDELREAHEFAQSALRARLSREQDARRKAEADLADAARVRDDAAELVARHMDGLEAELDAERAFNEQCLRDASESSRIRDEAAVALSSVFAALEAELESERARVAEGARALAETSRVRDDAAEAISEVIAAFERRVDELSRERQELRAMFEECDTTRESLAQASVEAARRATDARRRADELAATLDERTRQMAELAGVLTRATVEQHAIAGALRRGRVLPTMADVDAAIVAVGKRVPEQITEELWSARDAIAGAVFAGPAVGG